MSRYSAKDNLFPNRSHWDENGNWVRSATENSPICWCPENAPPPTNLCAACHKLRLRHSIFCNPMGWKNGMVPLDTLDELVKRPDCDFCSLIVLASKQLWKGKAWTGQSWEDAAGGQERKETVYLHSVRIENQRKKGYVLQVSMMQSWLVMDFEMVFRGHNVDLVHVERELEVWPLVDVERLKRMLRNCEENHEDCCALEPTLTPPEMHVIDLEDMSISVALDICRYVALSYVWGRSTKDFLTLKRDNITTLNRKNALKGVILPQTVKDAMHLCRDLGERYLWVDSLCIVQDDPSFQREQIDIMDSIYNKSVFTIVAGAGDHADSGLPGVSIWLRDVKQQTITIQDFKVSNIFPGLRDTVEKSVWNKRGWTYQERMFSQKCIFLTEAQAYFACSEGVNYEIKPNLETRYIERFKPRGSPRPFMEQFSKHVTDYTLRSLTQPADILRAFQGFMNEMERTSGQKFYFGLPSENFAEALLWRPKERSIRRVVPGMTLPSWSWASIMGPIVCAFTEEVISLKTTTPLPAFWQDGEAPQSFNVLWLLNYQGLELTTVNKASAKDGTAVSTSSIDRELQSPPPLPPRLYETALQKPGRLLFSTQSAFLSLQSRIPFTIHDTWWVDFVSDINTSVISIVSILPLHSGPVSPENFAGFIELDKVWVEENLTVEGDGRLWEFIAISLSTRKENDRSAIQRYMYTGRRNFNYPLVESRNVRQLLVNVMLVEWVAGGEVARRLGVGRVYLDFWEEANPKMRWVVLE